MKLTKKEIASYIDHTLLAPEASQKQISQICSEAIRYGFASVCVNPFYVPFVKESLKGSDVKVCSVIGFPFGSSYPEAKALEAKMAVKQGADEIDMVINIGAAIDGNYTIVSRDIATVVKAAKREGHRARKNVIVKVIMEPCFLDDESLKMCCLYAKKAGADFVKTSTGLASVKNIDGKLLSNGASEHHIKLMSETVGKEMGVKASGGISIFPNLFIRALPRFCFSRSLAFLSLSPV